MGTALLIMTVRRSELPPVVDDQQLRRSACLFQRFQPPHHICMLEQKLLLDDKILGSQNLE